MPVILFIVLGLTPIAMLRCATHSSRDGEICSGVRYSSAIFLLMMIASVVMRMYLGCLCFWGSPKANPLSMFVFLSIGFDVCLVVLVLSAMTRVLRNDLATSVRSSGGGCRFRCRALVLLFVVLLFYLVTYGQIIVAPLMYEDPEEMWFLLLDSLITSGIMGLYCIGGIVPSVWRLDRLQHEAARSMASFQGAKAPIVLLRSFEVDKYLLFGTSVDEFLCRCFSLSDAPVVSLGDPNESLPSGGSVKIQAKNEDWQSVVEELLHCCRAVILVEGLTAGLKWEIENVKRYITPDRFFVITLPSLYRMRVWYQAHTLTMLFHVIFCRRSVRQAFDFVWGRFRSYLQSEGFDAPEADPGGGKILLFNSDWKANRIVRPSRAKLLVREIVHLVDHRSAREVDYSRLVEKISAHVMEMKMDEVARGNRRQWWRVALTVASWLALIVGYAFLLAPWVLKPMAQMDDGEPNGGKMMMSLFGNRVSRAAVAFLPRESARDVKEVIGALGLTSDVDFVLYGCTDFARKISSRSAGQRLMLFMTESERLKIRARMKGVEDAVVFLIRRNADLDYQRVVDRRTFLLYEDRRDAWAMLIGAALRIAALQDEVQALDLANGNYRRRCACYAAIAELYDLHDYYGRARMSYEKAREIAQENDDAELRASYFSRFEDCHIALRGAGPLQPLIDHVPHCNGKDGPAH